MGLISRYKKAREAEKRKKNAPKPDINVDELDDDLNAGDALEAEIAAELEEERKRKR